MTRFTKKAALLAAMTVTAMSIVAGCSKKDEESTTTSVKASVSTATTAANAETSKKNDATEATTAKKEEKINIVDINSKERPYAVSINNTPCAVKVQTGLNKAFVVYEMPTEGYTSRLFAFYKGVDEDLTVGTIRSGRHNFLDVAYEWDAIFVHFGWSHYLEDEERAGAIDYINGLIHAPFWRENPENLDSEHTAYTSLGKIKDFAKEMGYASQSDKVYMPLKYTATPVSFDGKSDVVDCKSIRVPYSSYQFTVFEYDEASKMYLRYENGEPNVDYKTKEQFNTKNIIIQKVNHEMTDDNHYWNLETVGSGTGYYITDGKAVPITWSKADRKSQTVFKYADGSEVKLNDGRTYIELHATDMEITIQ